MNLAAKSGDVPGQYDERHDGKPAKESVHDCPQFPTAYHNLGSVQGVLPHGSAILNQQVEGLVPSRLTQ